MEVPAKLIKRMISGKVNVIFDSLGLLTPVLIRAKMLLKSLICSGLELGWDDAIPEYMRKKWVDFFNELILLKDISFKRCVKPKDSMEDPVMVIFCDASEKAFGACCYLRWKVSNGSFKSQLIASKSRVSPIKVKSIVRLEICGAVLGSRLAEFVEAECRFKIQKKYFIVDSEIVRSMIQKPSYGFNTYVAVQVGEIQEHTNAHDWYWIDSDANVADWFT